MNDSQSYTIRLAKTGLYFAVIDGQAGFIGDAKSAKIFYPDEHGTPRETVSRIKLIFDIEHGDVVFELPLRERQKEENKRRPVTLEDVALFCGQVNIKLQEHCHNEGYKFLRKCRVSKGRKYFRVEAYDVWPQHGECHPSIYFFVDPETGDILKAATHSRPAKHARGNIRDREFWNVSITPYGVVSLR